MELSKKNNSAHYPIHPLQAARERLAKVVERYKVGRPHKRISHHTPNQVYEAKSAIETKRLWKHGHQEKLALVNCL